MASLSVLEMVFGDEPSRREAPGQSSARIWALMGGVPRVGGAGYHHRIEMRTPDLADPKVPPEFRSASCRTLLL